MDAIKTYDLGNNKRLEIHADDNSESPRKWDNLTQMIFFGKHAHLGDKHGITMDRGFASREDFITEGAKWLRTKIKNVAIVKAVHAYIHSGMTISTSLTGQYADQWDSGTLGFVVITKDKLKKDFNVKRINAELLKNAERILEAEVETLDQYIRGDVYGFKLMDGEEEVDACWGFYGDEALTNGMADYLPEEVVTELKNQIRTTVVIR